MATHNPGDCHDCADETIGKLRARTADLEAENQRLREADEKVARRAFAAAVAAAESERLNAECTDGNRIYNRAVRDCVNAIYVVRDNPAVIAEIVKRVLKEARK